MHPPRPVRSTRLREHRAPPDQGVRARPAVGDDRQPNASAYSITKISIQHFSERIARTVGHRKRQLRALGEIRSLPVIARVGSESALPANVASARFR